MIKFIYTNYTTMSMIHLIIDVYGVRVYKGCIVHRDHYEVDQLKLVAVE